jgi:hypothetical protein
MGLTTEANAGWDEAFRMRKVKICPRDPKGDAMCAALPAWGAVAV